MKFFTLPEKQFFLHETKLHLKLANKQPILEGDPCPANAINLETGELCVIEDSAEIKDASWRRKAGENTMCLERIYEISVTLAGP